MLECELDSCSRPWSRRSAGFSTPRCSAARSQRRKGEACSCTWRCQVVTRPHAPPTATGRYEYGTSVWQEGPLPQSFNLSSVVTRWSLPANPFTDAELGSGISWALHPSFCGEILGLSRRRTWGCSPCSSPAMRSGRRWRAVLTCRSIECHGRARRVRLYRPQPRCRSARTLGAGQLAPRGPMQVNRCVPASEGVPYLTYLTYRGPWHHRWRAPSTRGLPTTRRSTSRT